MVNFLAFYRLVIGIAIVVLLLVVGYLSRELVGDSLLELYRQPFLLRCWTAFSFAVSALIVLTVYLLGIGIGFFLLVLAYAVLQEIYYQLMVRRVFRSFFEWLFQKKKEEEEYGENSSQRIGSSSRFGLD